VPTGFEFSCISHCAFPIPPLCTILATVLPKLEFLREHLSMICQRQAHSQVSYRLNHGNWPYWENNDRKQQPFFPRHKLLEYHTLHSTYQPCEMVKQIDPRVSI